jgi:hypothetical protein
MITMARTQGNQMIKGLKGFWRRLRPELARSAESFICFCAVISPWPPPLDDATSVAAADDYRPGAPLTRVERRRWAEISRALGARVDPGEELERPT